MNYTKRMILLLLAMFGLYFCFSARVQGYTLIPIPKTSGGYVTYRGTQIQAKMPDRYLEQDSDFRAVWISHLVGDIASYSTENQYKAEINRVFDILEYFNINAMIFHVRMNNDALYKSELNPVATYYSQVNFEKFDPLAWIIEESHKRGIEFHAWMNPYRIRSATSYPAYNIASNPEYILKGTSGQILDPGEPKVRKFVIDSVMELIQGYEVDAIHFDDYFYISGADDADTRSKYNTGNLSIGNFRRKQVDLFIEELSNEIHDYNQTSGRIVQLGISPSGIYRNGSYVPLSDYRYDSNGNLTYPLYSNTSGFSHYDAYLYSDTKKWIDNEWIDYILPQSYWAMEHSTNGYADIMDWWDMAVKNKNVNLYSGMGFYMIGETGNSSWNTNPRELANQIQYASKHENIRGHAIYSYTHLVEAYNPKGGLFFQNMKTVRETMWKNEAILPEIRTYPAEKLPSVNDFRLSKTSAGFRIDFEEMEEAKSYVIYRSLEPLTFSSSEVLDVIGNESIDGLISYIDPVNTNQKYYYGVKPLSKTNTLGQPASTSAFGTVPGGNLLSAGEFTNVDFSDNTFFGDTLTIRWDTLHPLYGGTAEYQVFASYDETHWYDINSSQNPIVSTFSTQTSKFKLDEINPKVFFKFKAFNSVSLTESGIYEVNVCKNIGQIRNFTYSSLGFAGDSITFRWSLMENMTDVQYIVQYADGEGNWNDITTSENPVMLLDTYATQTYTLPNTHSKSSYRIVATHSEGKAISNILELETFEYIGTLNIFVDGVTYSDEALAKEGIETVLSWNNLEHQGKEVTYVVRLSTDLKQWKTAREFNFQNRLVYGDTEIKQELNFTFQYYTVYAIVEAMSATGRSYSDILVLKVDVDYVKPTFFIQNLVLTQAAFLNSMNMFR